MPAPDLYDTLAAFVADTKAAYDSAKADGKVTASEALDLFLGSIERLVKLASEFTVAGADKKAAVLVAVDKLYDALLAPIDIPYVPEMVERTVLDPALKKGLAFVADRLIELFVKQLPPKPIE